MAAAGAQQPFLLRVTDGTRIEVELRHATVTPKRQSPVAQDDNNDRQPHRVVAVLLHPWGPLGGQCRDPVVAAVFRRLPAGVAASSCTVARFNARGVGLSESGGATSSFWQLVSTPTQRNERDANDLVDVVAHAIAEARAADDAEGRSRLRLWLVGYSHGSLVASTALPMLRARLPSMDAHAELAGVVAIAPPLGVICSVFLGATAAFAPFCDGGGGKDGEGLARLALLGTRDEFTSVAQLRAALKNGFEFGGEDDGGIAAPADANANADAANASPLACARLLEDADHFFRGRAGEVAEAAVAFIARVEEARRRRGG